MQKHLVLAEGFADAIATTQWSRSPGIQALTFGRVEERRGGDTGRVSPDRFRPFGSVSRSSRPTTPFPLPAHRTGRADFPHPALGPGSFRRHARRLSLARLAFRHSFRCSVWIFSGVARRIRQSPPSRAAPSAPWNQGSFPPPALPGFLGTTSPSATRSGQSPNATVGQADLATQTGFPCFSSFLVDMLSPTTPAKRAGHVVQYFPVRSSLPPVQAGSAFASCLSGPPRCSRMLRPANLQTARSCLLSPRLRPLRYLHDRWDSYPAGTTFAGAGLPPAGTTNLSRHTWTTTVALPVEDPSNAGVSLPGRPACRPERRERR